MPSRPAGPPFVMEVSLELGVVVVHAFGVLDERTATVVDECLSRLWFEGIDAIDLDLRGILYADGSATATLDAWADRADDEAGDLNLMLPPLQSGN